MLSVAANTTCRNHGMAEEPAWKRLKYFYIYSTAALSLGRLAQLHCNLPPWVHLLTALMAACAGT